jgi:acetylornithine deacetylase/succinyl-diaminopimelate desuccinylase-like protein
VTAPDFVDAFWEWDALAFLEHYVTLPCRSRMFDPDWEQTGDLDAAAKLICDWCAARGYDAEVIRLEGRTPTVFVDVPPTGDSAETIVLYGHFDKQPPFTGWRDGLDPYRAVREGDRVYGRGIADDGYSTFAAIGAIEALRDAGQPHGRVVLLIEGSEESGSPDLDAYLEHLRDRVGRPSVMIALDSGCLSYDRLWVTTSLRGLVGGTLRVEVLTQGVHSGKAGGVIPSSFRLLRQILSRIESESTGELPGFEVPIPEDRVAQAASIAREFGDVLTQEFPAVDGLEPSGRDATEQLLNATWRPSLAVTGLAGAPEPQDAGNVLRPWTEAKLALRIPPTLDSSQAAADLDRALTNDPPQGARVTFIGDAHADGWNAPPLQRWLTDALDEASTNAFGRSAGYFGEGGTIPFLGTLTKLYPDTQIVALGVLGPRSNAHGPDEFLHVPMVKAVTSCLAAVLAAHARA